MERKISLMRTPSFMMLGSGASRSGGHELGGGELAHRLDVSGEDVGPLLVAVGGAEPQSVVWLPAFPGPRLGGGIGSLENAFPLFDSMVGAVHEHPVVIARRL